MNGDQKYYKERLEFVRRQNIKALISAFNIIDTFAAPSLDPEMHSNYEEVKKMLIKRHKR